MTINSIGDIQKLVLDNFQDWKLYGHVATKTNGDLILFNYLPRAQLENRWTFLETVSRGLIIDRKTGQVVARPFDKFFNWMENGRRTDANIKWILEKVDGSLGILYRQDGQLKIATRGSFDGKQAEWAARHLNSKRYKNIHDIDDSLTLLFEIVYPENQIVVKYNYSGLSLLAARNRYTGEYLDYSFVQEIANRHGFITPKIYTFNNVNQVIFSCKNMEENEEGFVVEFEDGQRFKFKGEKYLQLHKAISEFTWNNVFDSVRGNYFDEKIEILPDKFQIQAIQWRDEIINVFIDIKMNALEIFFNAHLRYDIDKKEGRKQFAEYVNKNGKYMASICFSMLDGKSYDNLIWNLVEKKFRHHSMTES